MAEPRSSKANSIRKNLSKFVQRLSSNDLESTTNTGPSNPPETAQHSHRPRTGTVAGKRASVSQSTDRDARHPCRTEATRSVDASNTTSTRNPLAGYAAGDSAVPPHQIRRHEIYRRAVSDISLDRGTQTEHESLSSFLPEIFVSVAEPPSSETVFRDRPVPSYVACRLALIVDKRKVQYHKHLSMIRWQEGEAHKVCFDRIHDYVTSQTPKGQEFYTTFRQLRILEHIPQCDSQSSKREFHTTDTTSDISASFHVLDFLSKRDPQERQLHAEDISLDTQVWKEILPQKLGEQFWKRRDARIFIELRVAYTTYHAHKCDEKNSKSCRQVMKDDIARKRVFPDVRPQHGPEIWFVPRAFLDAYFDKSRIRHLIDVECWSSDDCDWNDEAFKEKVAADTLLFAVHLFALCIYADVGLDNFLLMYKAGVTDAILPISKERIDELLGLDSNESNNFRDYQDKFQAHQFLPSSPHEHEHEKIPGTTVLPFTLRHIHTSQGANGVVYKVQIHEDHHVFLPNRSDFMALKELRMVRMPPREIISSRMLSAMKNRHLTPLLASWTYQETSYMLFPWAECSLLDLLVDGPSPKFRDSLVDWFLTQTAGLASALDQIHNMRRNGPSGKKQHTGWHHDLKPSNILLFSDGMLKISDFGTAQIEARTSSDFQIGKSPNWPEIVGDWDYTAPDQALSKGISRPYDIFALGCIFVEMSCWLFGKGGLWLKDFRAERLAEALRHQTGDQCDSANFWIKEENNDPVLKAVVVKEIKTLKELANNKEVLRWLIMLIERMLTINPGERPESALVSSELHHLHQQANIDIQNNEDKSQDFFTLLKAPGSKVFGPSSTVDENARDCSVQSAQHNPTIEDLPRRASSPMLPGPDTLSRNSRNSISRAHSTAEALVHPDIISSGEQFGQDSDLRSSLDVLPASTRHADRESDSSSADIFDDVLEVMNVSSVPGHRS